MANSSSTQPPSPDHNVDDHQKKLNDLPKARFWDAMDITQWEGFWFEPGLVKPAITFRSTFQARHDDALLASTIKTGTTWLKSLTLCIMQNPSNNNQDHDILTMENPHFHVPTIESTIYSTKPIKTNIFDSSSPRLLHTHLPYSVLPDSVKNSRCKIVYIARNPKDTLVSMWHFFNSIFRPGQDPFPLQRALDCFCSGMHQYGSFFDHVLEYWLESQRRPEKVMFVRYEDMKSDPKGNVSRIAEFLGKPFGDEREVDEVVWRCSLERMKNLEVNKSGSIYMYVPNTSFSEKARLEIGRTIFHLRWKNRSTMSVSPSLSPLDYFFN